MSDHFIKLSCSNCDGVLNVYDDVDKFACVYCGAKMLVQRRCGTVALALAEAVRKVQISTDNTAADLAIARLTEEKRKLVKRREGLLGDKLRRTKWGFGIGGALLLIGIVASKTVKNLNLVRFEAPDCRRGWFCESKRCARFSPKYAGATRLRI